MSMSKGVRMVLGALFCGEYRLIFSSEFVIIFIFSFDGCTITGSEMLYLPLLIPVLPPLVLLVVAVVSVAVIVLVVLVDRVLLAIITGISFMQREVSK